MIDRIRKMMQNRNIWKKRISAFLACVVVFVTVYAMVLPAITLDREAADQNSGIVLEEDDEGTVNENEETFDYDGEEFEDAEGYESDPQEDVPWPVTLEWPRTPEWSETLTGEAEFEDFDAVEENEEVPDYHVIATIDENSGLPADVSLQVVEIEKDTDEYKAYCESALEAVRKEGGDEAFIRYARFFDITFLWEGEVIEPTGPVSIVIDYDDEKELDAETAENLSVVHFDKEEIEEPKLVQAETEVEDDQVQSVSFESDSFSVYGVVTTYTVDFHYEVDGQIYEFTLPEGGFVSLEQLVELLGIVNTETNAASDVNITEIPEEARIRKFVADVENVEFSSPELVWVGKTDIGSTVGELKELYGLNCENSADLTKEQIAGIDAQTLEAGDWALISMQPFASEESLTVTMKNGDQFVVKVTDAQIKGSYLTDGGETYEIEVTYSDDANIPNGTELSVREIEEDSDEYLQLLGDSWSYINREYLEREQRSMNGEAADAREERIHVRNILQARFFDITFMYQGEEIEPDAPVQVDIRLKDGMNSMSTAESYVLHYADSDEENKKEGDVSDRAAGDLERRLLKAAAPMHDAEPEMIADVQTTGGAERIHSFSFEQGSFSVDGLVTAVKADGIVRNNVSLRASTAGDALIPLEAHKWKTYNDDGTHKIHLNVTGDALSSTDVEKANVIIIMDESSSMNYGEFTAAGTIQNGQPVDFTPDSSLAYYYISGNGPSGGLNGSALTYYNGNYCVRNSSWLGTRYEPYTGPVYTFKSRLAYEQEALNALVNRLMENNTVTPGAVEISVIGFNNGAWNKILWSTDAGAINAEINEDETSDETHWWAALNQARGLASDIHSSQPDEDVYVLFLTDGKPLQKEGYGGLNTNSHYDDYCVPAVQNLMQLGDYIHLYNIFTYSSLIDKDLGANNPGGAAGALAPDTADLRGGRYPNEEASYLSDLTSEAQAIGDAHFKNAQTVQDVADELGDILSQVNKSVAYGRVSVTDTLTANASATALVNGRADGFTYMVSGAREYTVTATGGDNPTVTFTIGGQEYPGEEKNGEDNKKYYEVTVNEQVYKMALASFDEGTHKVDWDLGGIGALEKGCTYEVSFDIWPNQDAYDYVADLNNGKEGVSWNASAAQPVYTDETQTVIKYYKGGVSEYPDIVKYGEDGPYAVLTNTDQEVTYSVVKVTDGVTTYEEPVTKKLETPDPMDLTDRKIQVKKVWEDSLDTSQLSKVKAVELKLTKDEEDYITGIEIQPLAGEKTWPERDDSGNAIVHDISAGLMISEGKASASGLKSALDKYPDKYPTVSDGTTTYYILDEGYDYSFEEVVGDTRFELEKKIYHPMVVDGQLRDVTFSAGAGGSQTAEISNLPVTEQGSSIVTLQAKNVLKGGINIKKTVKEGNQTLDYDGLFSADIILTPPADDTNIANIEDYLVEKDDGTQVSKGKVAWYYYIDERGRQIYDEALIQAGILEDSGKTNDYGRIGKGENYDGGGWFVLWFQDYGKGEELHPAAGTLTLSPKYPIRFTNMASGTGYSLQETETNGMTPSITVMK